MRGDQTKRGFSLLNAYFVLLSVCYVVYFVTVHVCISCIRFYFSVLNQEISWEERL